MPARQQRPWSARLRPLLVRTHAHYDNSPNNKWNPAPDKEVFWSEQSWDEMYNPQIRWTWDLQDVSKEAAPTGGGQQ